MSHVLTPKPNDTRMKDLASAPPEEFGSVRFVLTDMDETLTHKGRLSAAVYGALERLQAAGLKVIVVTAAPAGWCDQMARMWPLDGVIGENGGLFFRRNGSDVLRQFWHEDAERERIATQLVDIGQRICTSVPGAMLANDQSFRLTSLALARPASEEMRGAILSKLVGCGLNATQNNLWLLGWAGSYNKLTMTKRVLAEHFETDVETDGAAACYCGDSENDSPMFRFFKHSIGMSTARNEPLSCDPVWITQGPGGTGFVEAADAILGKRI